MPNLHCDILLEQFMHGKTRAISSLALLGARSRTPSTDAMAAFHAACADIFTLNKNSSVLDDHHSSNVFAAIYKTCLSCAIIAPNVCRTAEVLYDRIFISQHLRLRLLEAVRRIP